MSKNPGGLYVRDTEGIPVLVPLESIPKELWPDTWFENAYWRFNGALSLIDVKELYGQEPVSEEFIQKVAQYIFDFAANCAVCAWLFDDAAHRQGYLEHVRPLLQQLSALKQTARNREDVHGMLDIAAAYALDPM
jgi:hypothetical protein